MSSTVVKIVSDKEYSDLEQELGVRVQYVEPFVAGVQAIFQRISVPVVERIVVANVYTLRQSDVEQGLTRLIVKDI